MKNESNYEKLSNNITEDLFTFFIALTIIVSYIIVFA